MVDPSESLASRTAATLKTKIVTRADLKNRLKERILHEIEHGTNHKTLDNVFKYMSDDELYLELNRKHYDTTGDKSR